MNQDDSSRQMPNPNPDLKSDDSVEQSILTLLQTNHQQGRTIDVSWLQAECSRVGYSPKEFSHGFVKLLISGHLEPRGEFAYALAAAKTSEVCYGK